MTFARNASASLSVAHDRAFKLEGTTRRCARGFAVFSLVLVASAASAQTPSAGGEAPVAQEPAANAPATAPTESPGPAQGGTAAGDVFADTAATDLTATDCEGTNRALWVGIAAMDAIALMLFFIAFAVVTSRTWLRRGALGNFLTVLAPFGALAAVLVGSIRPAQELFAKCMESPDLRQLLQLVEFTGWQRGLVFGLVPVVVLAFLLKAVHGKFFVR